MTLKANAFITVEELKNHLGYSASDLQAAMLSVINSASGATAATVQVTSTSVVLVVTGGGSAGTSTLTFAANATLSAMVTAINALNKGWTANLQGMSTEDSSTLTIVAATSALTTVTLYGEARVNLELAIDSACQTIEDFTGCTFNVQTFTDEFSDGDGLQTRWLEHYPVTSITSLAYYDQYAAADTYTMIAGKDYYITKPYGRLDVINGVFMSGQKNIRCTYVAGYSVVPSDIKESALVLCEVAISNRGKNGLSSVTIGRYSETRKAQNETVAEMQVLGKYKRVLL
jgi:hypothetical protein